MAKRGMLHKLAELLHSFLVMEGSGIGHGSDLFNVRSKDRAKWFSVSRSCKTRFHTWKHGVEIGK